MQWLLGKDNNPIDVNSRRSIIAIVYVAVIAPCVFILQPGYVQGLVQYLSFSDEQAGYIASAEMFGIAFTTVLLIFMEARFDWRKLTVLCLIVATAGNLLSLSLVDFESLIAVRFLTGMGSGGLMSLTFAMMGLTDKSDRNFGYIITWVLIYGALGILVMPAAFATIGMDGVLLFFALFNISGLWFARHLPRSGVHHLDSSVPEKAGYSARLKGLSLLAILVLQHLHRYRLGLPVPAWAGSGYCRADRGECPHSLPVPGYCRCVCRRGFTVTYRPHHPPAGEYHRYGRRYLYPGGRDRFVPVCPGSVPVQLSVECEYAIPVGNTGFVRPQGEGGNLRYLHADGRLCHRPFHRRDHPRQEQL